MVATEVASGVASVFFYGQDVGKVATTGSNGGSNAVATNRGVDFGEEDDYPVLHLTTGQESRVTEWTPITDWMKASRPYRVKVDVEGDPIRVVIRMVEEEGESPEEEDEPPSGVGL